MNETEERRLTAVFSVAFAVLFAVGAAGHLFPSTRPLMVSMTWYVLLLNTVMVLLPLVFKGNRRLALWYAGAYAVGFTLEVLGVGKGQVFGMYAYGGALGPALLGVPLLIGLNWALVILGSVTLANAALRGRAGPVVVALAAAALTVLFDWFMEPVAMRLGYWSWTGGAVPLRNYAAWFLIAGSLSLGALVLFRPAMGAHPSSRLAAVSTTVQLAFFALLRVTLV
jgi:bisanhydrobacterioruberin hydratase